MPAQVNGESTSLGDVTDALTKAGCTPDNKNVATCPICRKERALKFRRDSDRIMLRCKTGCDESTLRRELEIGADAKVVPMVLGGSGTGTGSRFPPLRGNRHSGTSSKGLEPEPLVVETLEAFLARSEAAPPPEWLVDPLVPTTGSVLLVSPPNAGKTFFALVIAKTAAVQGRHVVIVEDEGGLHAFGDRIKNLAFSADAPVSVIFQRGVKLDAPTLLALTNIVQEVEAPVLILDPLASLFIGNENETEEAQAVMNGLRMLIRANPRLLLVVLHHSSKLGARGDGPAVYSSRGSSTIPAWFDTQLALEGIEEPDGSGRISFFIDNPKQRDAQRASRRKMSIDLGTGEVSLVKAGEAARDDRSQKVINALKAEPDGLSRNDIAKEIGGNKQQALRTISSLVAAGTLVDGTKGLRLKPAAPTERPAS